VEIARKRFTPEQVITMLREAEVLLSQSNPIGEVCRKLEISEQTFFRWKKKYGGLGVSELRRLRQLEEENRQLKRLVADLTLDKQMLQDVLSKKF
jgi:putative transposase